MTNRKKILMATPYFLLWIFYFFFTLEERNEYMMAKSKGCKCIGSEDTSFLVPGSERTYYFSPTEKPQREYLTWKEFWEKRGY